METETLKDTQLLPDRVISELPSTRSNRDHFLQADFPLGIQIGGIRWLATKLKRWHLQR
jgi:hypothetical protein